MMLYFWAGLLLNMAYLEFILNALRLSLNPYTLEIYVTQMRCLNNWFFYQKFLLTPLKTKKKSSKSISLRASMIDLVKFVSEIL